MLVSTFALRTISSVRGWMVTWLTRRRRQVEGTIIENTAAKRLWLWLGRSRPSFRKLKNDGVVLCPNAMAGASELERETKSNGR